MEVTQKNFKESLEKIRLQLQNAEFVSYDLELTGLGRSFGLRNHDLDTPEERYLKDRPRVREYGIIQMGLSIFRFCQSEKKYISSTYCFFLSGNCDGSYRFDSSSMTFLAENGFDFNKLFTEGLPFMSLLEESEIREKRTIKNLEEQVSPLPSPVKIKNEDTASLKFMKDAVEKVKLAQEKSESLVFLFSSMTSFHRKLLYNNVAPKFPNCLFKSNKYRDIEVFFYDSEDEKLKNKDKQWEDDLSDKIGFAHVVKALLESNKPLVGHNIYLDVLHFVDKFIAPLPESYEEFKSLVRSNLPSFYDTKLVAKDPPFSADIINTALGCLYTELVSSYSPPELEIEKGGESYKLTDTGQAHDGGYDAFMTGICLITMLKTLDGKKWASSSPAKSKFLKAYSNRINFMGSYDIPFLDMDRPEVIPRRSHIFSVQCPSTFTAMNVRTLFSSLKSYKTLWVNDNQLYVIPQEESDIDNASILLEGIRSSSPPNVHVSLYKENNPETNGKLSVATEEQTEIKNHSSISCAIKRKSNIPTSPDNSTQESEPGKNLKRLKSFGSEQLSNMSLDSPMEEDKELIQGAQKDLSEGILNDLVHDFQNFNVSTGQEASYSSGQTTGSLERHLDLQIKFQEKVCQQLNLLTEQNTFIWQKLLNVTHDLNSVMHKISINSSPKSFCQDMSILTSGKSSSHKFPSTKKPYNSNLAKTVDDELLFLPKSFQEASPVRTPSPPVLRPIPSLRISKLKSRTSYMKNDT